MIAHFVEWRGLMRAYLVPLGFLITLLSASLAHGQVSIDVSKVTCDQFANGKVGLPRTTAIWLNGYYHGKRGSTVIDTQQSEAMFTELMNFCQTGENGKVLVMQAIEHLLKPITLAPH
jgi:acid stress chaperone HdeB